MAASKTTKKRKRKPAAKQQPVGNRFQTEILILVMFAACLILMISAFGMGGIVGNAISADMLWHHGTLCIYFPNPAFCRSYVPDREQYQPPCLQKGTGGRGIFCVPLRLSSADHRGLYAKVPRFRIIIH